MRYNYFVPSRYQEFVQRCLKVIKSGEPALFFFAPKTDRIWRIDQFIQDNSDSYVYVKVTLIPEETESIEDVEFHIKRQIPKGNKKDVVVFITNAELCMHEKNYSLIEAMARLSEKDPKYKMLLFFEDDITAPSIANRFTFTSLFSNIVFYPLYDREDTKTFINYLCEKWDFKPADIVKDKLAKESGGHLWLIKTPIRMLRDGLVDSFDEMINSEQLRFRLEQITHCFSELEQNVLYKLIKKEKLETIEEKHAYNYLKTMNVINDEGEIGIGMLAKYLKENLPKINIEISESKLMLNAINVESHFSKKEKRTLKVLLENQNRVVTRDQIAKAIWPLDTEEQYSDWAVDRIIARLRNKLETLGMSKEMVKTLRNKGYMLVN